jgi:hypothetical protein
MKIRVWNQERNFRTDRRDGFRRAEKKIELLYQCATMDRNNRVGVGGPAILEGIGEK